MDLPGPSNLPGSNNIIRPVSMYYAPPTPPQMAQQPAPIVPALNVAASTPIPWQLYLNALSTAAPTNNNNKSQYLTRSELSAFKEVNDLRTAVNMILPMLPIYQQLPNGLGAAAANLAAAAAVSATAAAAANAPQPQQQQQQLQSVLSQNLMRKRSTTAAAPAPECPVSMRSVLSASNLQNAILLNQWMMPPMRAPSPTLPNGNVQTVHQQTNESQVPNGEEQAVKWSSPSSVDSNGQKTDSSTASASDSQNIDIVGDGNESSTSSASAQDQIAQSIYNAVQNAAAQQAQLANVLKTSTDTSMFFPSVSQAETNALRIPTQLPSSSTSSVPTKPSSTSYGPERKPRKPVNDDIVKIVRQQDLRPEAIATIEIPVPKAVESDPSFRPVSEQQIIQQIIQGKKYEEMEVGECMIQLCKKLAEKRVFGPRLMSQTTVAGLNHSNYSNLPIKGICYIQHVCWKVLRNRFGHEEEFWDKFREAMRKLAARCRRVRHAKKTKNNREESLAQQDLLAKRYGEETIMNVPSSLSHTIQSLGLSALRPKPENNLEGSGTNDTSNMSIGQLGQLVLQNFSDSKNLKSLGEQESTVVQSLLRMANSCTTDYKIDSKPLSPV